MTDYFDGRIARARGQVSPLGIFLDLTADKVLVAGVLIAMVEVGLLPTWIVATLLVRELVVQGVRQLAASASVVISARGLGKWKAFGTNVAIGVLLLAFDAQTGGPGGTRRGGVDRPGDRLLAGGRWRSCWRSSPASPTCAGRCPSCSARSVAGLEPAGSPRPGAGSRSPPRPSRPAPSPRREGGVGEREEPARRAQDRVVQLARAGGAPSRQTLVAAGADEHAVLVGRQAHRRRADVRGRHHQHQLVGEDLGPALVDAGREER